MKKKRRMKKLYKSMKIHWSFRHVFYITNLLLYLYDDIWIIGNNK